MRAVRRKIRSETRLQPEAGFPRMGPLHYLPYLEQMHATLAPKVYLEIGTESGASLNYANCVSFAVDPAFNLQTDVSRNKPELYQYQGTSDAFFAADIVTRLGYKVDLAFLDGLHLFEFLLRDFINTERLMAPGGVITMHDCVPINHLSAERDWDREKTANWVGDVWKLIPILRQYRPDLKVDVLDLIPTALVKVTALNPGSTILRDNYNQIVSDYAGMSLLDFGLIRFAEVCDIVRCGAGSEAPEQTSVAVPVVVLAQDAMTIAIKTSVRTAAENQQWGDFHFAASLSKAFTAAGHGARVDAMPDWNSDNGESDIDLVLHGTRVWKQRPSVPSVQWVLYPGGANKRDILTELRKASHVLVSSQVAVETLRVALPGVPVSVLMQGFDADSMYPDDTPKTEDVVFVGNNHSGMQGGRPIIELVVKAGVPIKIWGGGWEKHGAAPYLVAQSLPNGELGDLYRRSKIVLCDHMPSMRTNGYISNRIFDALACGVAVISDRITGLPEEFAPFVHLCDTVDELTAAVAEILAERPEKLEERQRFARSMRDRHSLQHRATTILDVCQAVVQARKYALA